MKRNPEAEQRIWEVVYGAAFVAEFTRHIEYTDQYGKATDQWTPIEDPEDVSFAEAAVTVADAAVAKLLYLPATGIEREIGPEDSTPNGGAE